HRAPLASGTLSWLGGASAVPCRPYRECFRGAPGTRRFQSGRAWPPESRYITRSGGNEWSDASSVLPKDVAVASHCLNHPAFVTGVEFFPQQTDKYVHCIRFDVLLKPPDPFNDR